MEYAKIDGRRYDSDGVRRGSVQSVHRAAMEKKLGRPLKPSEIVHHKDHNKRSNGDDNLELTNRSAHVKLHAEERRKEFGLKCRIDGCATITLSKYILCHKHSTIQGMWARKRGGRTGDWLGDWLKAYKPREAVK